MVRYATSVRDVLCGSNNPSDSLDVRGLILYARRGRIVLLRVLHSQVRGSRSQLRPFGVAPFQSVKRRCAWSVLVLETIHTPYCGEYACVEGRCAREVFVGSKLTFLT